MCAAEKHRKGKTAIWYFFVFQLTFFKDISAHQCKQVKFTFKEKKSIELKKKVLIFNFICLVWNKRKKNSLYLVGRKVAAVCRMLNLFGNYKKFPSHQIISLFNLPKVSLTLIEAFNQRIKNLLSFRINILTIMNCIMFSYPISVLSSSY